MIRFLRTRSILFIWLETVLVINFQVQYRQSSLGNKTNLRNLIAATSLESFLKLDSNRWFFCPCDLEIWWTSKNKRAPLLYYIQLCAYFHIHRWTQTGITVRKRSIRVNFWPFGLVWPWILMDDLGKQQDTYSILHQSLCIITMPWVY